PELGPGGGHSLAEQTTALAAKKETEQAWANGIRQTQFDRALQHWGDEGLTAVGSWLRGDTNPFKALCGDFVCFEAEGSQGNFRLDRTSDFGRGSTPSTRVTVRALFSRGHIPLTIVITQGRVTAPGLTTVGTPVIDGPINLRAGARILVLHPDLCLPDDFQLENTLKSLAEEGEAMLARSYQLTVLRKQHAIVRMAANGPVADGGDGDKILVEQLAEWQRHPCTLELRADHTLAISNYPRLGDARQFVTVSGTWSLSAQRERGNVQFQLSVNGGSEVKPRSAACDLFYPNHFNPYARHSPEVNLLCRDEAGGQLELWFKATPATPPSDRVINPYFVSRPSSNRPPNWDTAIHDSPRAVAPTEPTGLDPNSVENLQRVVATRREQFGNESTDLADTLGLLSSVLRDQGKLTEAEAARRENLAIRLKALGSEHPRVALSYESLGTILQLEGKLDEAEKSMREALAIRRKAFGDESPQVRDTLARLTEIQQLAAKADGHRAHRH
ncbi:MAG: hypothetical protein RIQ79_2469, partial [Verrucomicrobiota bacterium]